MTSLYGSADPAANSAVREPPMFALNRMNIHLNHDIEQLVANNQTMVVLMGRVLHRIPLNNDPIEQLPELPAGVRIVRMFLDPQGSHLLLTVRLPSIAPMVQQHMQQASSSGKLMVGSGGATGSGGDYTHELWYLHRTSREPKRCERYRGHEITAVGWNRAGGADAMTGAILLGTSRGVLFETELSCMPGEKRGGASVSWKQVFDIGQGEQCPITGLEFHKVTNTGRHVVVVTTPNRMYQFCEDLVVEERYPYLHHIFASYLNKPEQATHLLSAALANASLRFLYDPPTANYPRFYGWLTADGLYAGDIRTAATAAAAATADQFDFLGTREIIPYPVLRSFTSANGDQPPSAAPVSAGAQPPAHPTPIAFELTDYHVLLLYADRVVAVSRLTHATVYEQPLTDDPASSTGSAPLGMCRNQRAGGTVFLFSRKAIVRVRVRDEQRHVWRQHLERGDFEAAQRATNNAAHLNQILVREADVCFERGQFARAAQRYAESRAGFEAVCLQFMQAVVRADATTPAAATSVPARREALILFVRQRLDRLKDSEQTQITMLVVWLVELYVAEMAAAGAGSERRRRLQADYEAFMAQTRVAACVHTHRHVVGGLLEAHGDTGNLAALRATGGDVETVLEQHIELGDWAAALAVLRQHAEPELFYRWAPVLMEELPKQTAEVLRQQDRLDVERLLPVLMCVDTEAQRGEVMRFLEWGIHKRGCTSQAWHHYLIQLYARWWPKRLMAYLTGAGTAVELVHYDVQFALRVCNKYATCNEASVFLYCRLELWSKAVELALTFDPLLAEQTAALTDDQAVRRQLWLQIARHGVQRGDNVRQALQVLHKCDGLLRIEDVLPHFNDFDRIEHFKEAVIDALHQSNDEVQRYREEMDESARAAEVVRDELQAFRQRSVRVAADAPCSVCAALLMQRPFLMFQCGHMVHVDCAERAIAKQMGPDDRKRLAKLHERMAASSPVAAVAEQLIHGLQTDRELAKSEYEELIAAECLFCGNFMIESIDRPFGGDGDVVIDDLDGWA